MAQQAFRVLQVLVVDGELTGRGADVARTREKRLRHEHPVGPQLAGERDVVDQTAVGRARTGGDAVADALGGQAVALLAGRPGETLCRNNVSV